MSPEEKCAHGVYNPFGDGRYCTICKPVQIEHDVVVLEFTEYLADGKMGRPRLNLYTPIRKVQHV